MFETVQLSNREKSFFPAHWSSDKVVENIIEASKNIVDTKDKGYVVELQGVCIDSTQIRIIVEKTGKIKTAYPII